jgi:hypothetical protein
LIGLAGDFDHGRDTCASADHNVDVAELIEDAARELYARPPDDFMARRAELAEAARKAGEGAAATAIGKLRKPTVGAWLVNALVLDDPSVVDQLIDLGERLRAAQDALDAGKLRELSDERRKLVDKLTTTAFRKADRAQPPAALRDEVNVWGRCSVPSSGPASASCRPAHRRN